MASSGPVDEDKMHSQVAPQNSVISSDIDSIRDYSTEEPEGLGERILKLLKEASNVINLLLELSGDQLEAELTSDLAGQLFKILKHTNEYLNKLQPETFQKIGDLVCSKEVESIVLLYKFHEAFFLKLGTGLHHCLIYSLIYSLIVLGTLSDGSKKVREYLIGSGSLYQNFYELEELKKTLAGDEIAHKFLICNLMVLHNCSIEFGFHRYFLRLDPAYFFDPSCKSPSFAVRVHSKFIAGRLVPFISSMNSDIIKLEDSDIKMLCEMLGQVSSSNEFEVRRFECVFSAVELIGGIRNLLHNKLNRKRLLSNGILTSLVAILVGGGVSEKKEVCLAIFDLTADETFVKMLDLVELPLVDLLTELQLDADTEFNLLLSGILCLLPNSQGAEPCPEASYKYNRYDLCLKQCDEIIDNKHVNDYSNSTIQSAYLLRAKCLYHNYRNEQLVLAGSNMEEKIRKDFHNECYMKARNAIISLGNSELDSEGAYMLDIAMMEYATETNRLDDIRRCLLCQAKEKLIRSHMCPYSILKEFCAGSAHPENLQIFETSSESSSVGHMKSPKQMTTYAFCKNCENKLNTYGEQEFLPRFFRKIYSVSGDSDSEKFIEYGPWLYHFCAGIFFRALIKNNINTFFNFRELYEFFLKCRSVVLNPSFQQEPNHDFPHIYLLFGPHKCNDQDQEYGFINQALTEAYLSTIQTSSLSDGVTKPPYPAHYLLVHIGIMNFIAIFSPSSPCILPEECQVDPVGGVFRVPAEEERAKSFPSGLWKFYRLYAIEKSRRWLERPLAPLQRNQKRKFVTPSVALEAVFHIGSSATSDVSMFETHIIPSPDPNHPRVITLLPSGFSFCPHSNPSSIQLPVNHRILLHFPKGNKEVYFLAVGQSGKTFTESKPYVIYSHCEPGLQFCSAFFVDPIHLTFKEFLPLREGRVLLERMAIFDELKKNIQARLKEMLRCKGIASLPDILQLYHYDKLKNIDLKCFGREYCWYCINRCSFCLQITGSNYSKLDDYGKTLRFCSQECQKKLQGIVPLEISLHHTPTVQTDSKSIVSLTVSGTGQISSSELVYRVNLNMYIEADCTLDESIAKLKSFAFFQCRSFHLQTAFQLSLDEQNSKIMLSLLPEMSIPKSVQDSFNVLLTQILSQFMPKKVITLHSLYNYLIIKSQGSIGYVISSFDSAMVCKLPFPILEVTIMQADSLLKETSKASDKQNKVSSLDKSEKVSQYPTLEKTEDGLLEPLKNLPPNFVITTKFSSSVSLVNFIRKCQVESCHLPIELLEKLCLIHFQKASDILKFPLKERNDMNEATYSKLLEHFKTAQSYLKHLPALGRKEVGDNVEKMKSLTNTLSQLCELLYCGLNNGLSVTASQCFLMSMTTVASLCSCSSSLRIVLLSSTNIVVVLVCQLWELRQVVPLDQYIKELIVATIQFCGSLSKECRYHWQLMEADFPHIITPYLRSSLTNTALAAKIALAPLSHLLDDDAINLLKVTESQFFECISLVDVSLTQVDILPFLKLLLSHDKSALSDSKLAAVLDSVSRVLQQGSDFILEKRAALNLLWKLTYLGCSSSIASHLDLTAQLLSLTGHDEVSLQRVVLCILWRLDTDQREMPEFYTEQCYLNGFYDECVSDCESSSLTEFSDQRRNIMLAQGKALFHVYSIQQEVLKKQHLPEGLYRSKQSAYFSKIRLAIQILGSLLDNNQLDNEGSKILDLCMIDYAYKTNQSCQRCLLCRKKNSLKKSHMWPRALLEDFSKGVERPTSHRALQTSWQSQDKYLLAPKEVTLYLFCESCEGLLSKHGETQFVPKFFRQLYDINVPEKPQSAFTIEYGTWLYEFCVGIVFRGIAQRNMQKFVNSDEIYGALTLCRGFLLSCLNHKATNASALDPKKPEVFVMISPTKVEGKDTESGFINRVLNMPAFYGVEELELSDGSVTVPRAAQFFIAHFGLINILIKFEHSTYTFTTESRIDPNGGIFIVPENKYRKSILPVGVWNLFLRLAQDFEVKWLTRSTEAVVEYSKPNKKQPEKTIEETFGFVAATERDFEALKLHMGSPAPNNAHKNVSFLPKQFKIHRSDQQANISLPKSHHVLLHFLIPLRQDAQETMFLCVGSDETYSYQKPYVIYHYYQQDGFQLSTGFFISTTDLSAEEFLPGAVDKFEVNKIKSISEFRRYIPKLLLAMLERKGFKSFNSLYLRLNSGGDISTVDMKCVSPSRCWYCLNRCEFCMEETEVGCLWIKTGPIPICFCSSCQQLYTEKKKSLDTKVLIVQDKLVPFPVTPLSPSHKALLYIKCESTSGMGQPVLIRMTLCSDEHSENLPIEAPYVMYHFWTVFQQQFLEFTVGTDMVPNRAVVYTDSSLSEKAVSEAKELGLIQKVLSQGIQFVGLDTMNLFQD